ncbi:urease accessory protein UreE [Candidatus Nitrososphaera sp. FF02]|uniref:urease accessory protein UreE n=1 Tax=Candidatus Nitrososphaera sp. FF02 TaxID=3398226 RepID=UPI0039EC199A
MKEKHAAMSARGAVEKMRISRMEAERTRMRKTTDKGTDVALTLAAGTRLRHGDILTVSERMIIVEQEPEMVAVVRIDKSDPWLAALVGHAIGNLHRPIKVDGSRIFFPIQAESELEMLRRQFSAVIDSVEISTDTMVFEPEGVSAHEH